MFSGFEFAESDFADGLSEIATIPAQTVTRRRLSVECKTRICEDISGVPPGGDLTIYNLQDAIFFNGTALSFLVECPDGYVCPSGTFPQVFTYPPGTFVFPKPNTPNGNPIVLSMKGCSSQVTIVLAAGSSAAAQNAAANQIFNQIGAQQAQCDAIKELPPGSRAPVSIHLSDIPQYYCVGIALDESVTATYSPHTLPTTFTLNSNQLPAGVNVSQTTTEMFLSGTPTTIANYSFQVTATAPNAQGTKIYSMSIVGIATASPLPSADVNLAYSETLDASSIPGVLTWSVIAGALPSWLSLNSATGELSGTPLTGDDGSANFTILASNGTIACSKEFDLTITDTGGIFGLIIWDPPGIALVGSGAGTASGLGNSFNDQSSVGVYTAGPANTALITIVGNLTITLGSPVNGFATATTIGNLNLATNLAQCFIDVNAALVFQRQNFGANFGTGAFVVPAGINQTVKVTLSCYSASGAGAPPDGAAKNCSVSGSIAQL